MHKFSPEMIAAIAATMADSFMEDPLMVETFAGIINHKEMIYQHALLQVNHFSQHGEIHLIDNDPRAFLIGLDSRDEKKFAEPFLFLRILLKTLQMLNLKDIRRMLANNSRVSQVLDLAWQKKFVTKRYYHIKIIAVSAALRGSGVFRKLITPVLAYCDLENIPAILETHNPNNVPLYEHFGFGLATTKSSPRTGVQQFCMIRPPQPLPR